jgi:hypothetical protein
MRIWLTIAALVLFVALVILGAWYMGHRDHCGEFSSTAPTPHCGGNL